jgi:mitogen-activated protein kinase 1/3
LPEKPKQPASKCVAYPDAKARNLLDKMLEMNPKNRITAREVLFF